MDFRLVPRTEIGLPATVYANDGKTPRPKLQPFLPYVTVHYTGAYVSFADIGDTPAEIRSVEASAQKTGKSNEYNYVIGTDPDNLIYEYAGQYQAAHSAGENSIAYGVLFMNGVEDVCTDLQVEKFRWLVSVLKAFHMVKSDVLIKPHKDMPGAATACPGKLILSRWPELIVPFDPPPSPPLAAHSGCYVQIQAGDTWPSLTTRIYGKATAPLIANLIAYNGSPQTLNPGTFVRVPGMHGSI